MLFRSTSKQGRWARHQRDNGTGPFQDRLETLLSVVLKIYGHEMSRARLDGNLDSSFPLLRSKGDNIRARRRLARFAIGRVVSFLQCCHAYFSLSPPRLYTQYEDNTLFYFIPVIVPVGTDWNRSCKASLFHLRKKRKRGRRNSGIRFSVSPLIRSQESFAVEVDEMRRRVSTPDFGFPGNLSKVTCHDAAIGKGRDID